MTIILKNWKTKIRLDVIGKVMQNHPVKVLTAASIIVDKVVNAKDEAIGKIKDIILLNIHDGKIEYVAIELGGLF